MAQAAYDTLQTVYYLPTLINRSRLVLFGVERRSQDLGAESIAAVLSVANALSAAGRLNEFNELMEFPISEILGFDSDDGAGRMALLAGNTVQAAEVAIVLSRDATLHGQHGSAEWYATRAFQALNSARYLLRSQRHRHAWVEAHRAAIGCLLRVVARRNPSGLIEVIENARLQGLPQGGVPDSVATAPATPDPSHADEAHDDVQNGRDRALRAAGISAPDPAELPLRAPIGVVTDAARPSTLLGRAMRASTEVASLEMAREIASGAHSWWYGTWVDGATLFWGLINGNGSAWGGEISLSPESPAASALEALRQALPMSFPGEDKEARKARMRTSPLLANPSAELRLAQQLGHTLLPATLRRWRLSGVS